MMEKDTISSNEIEMEKGHILLNLRNCGNVSSL